MASKTPQQSEQKSLNASRAQYKTELEIRLQQSTESSGHLFAGLDRAIDAYKSRLPSEYKNARSSLSKYEEAARDYANSLPKTIEALDGAGASTLKGFRELQDEERQKKELMDNAEANYARFQDEVFSAALALPDPPKYGSSCG